MALLALLALGKVWVFQGQADQALQVFGPRAGLRIHSTSWSMFCQRVRQQFPDCTAILQPMR